LRTQIFVNKPQIKGSIVSQGQCYVRQPLNIYTIDLLN